MFRDFYATMAQVFPVLLLTFAWESRYLQQLRAQTRVPRRHSPSGVLFWTKPRVRGYALTVVGVIVIDIVTAVLVLAGVFPDSFAIRVFLLAGLALILGTLMTRMSVDIIEATRGPTVAGRATDTDGPGA